MLSPNGSFPLFPLNLSVNILLEYIAWGEGMLRRKLVKIICPQCVFVCLFGFQDEKELKHLSLTDTAFVCLNLYFVQF